MDKSTVRNKTLNLIDKEAVDLDDTSDKTVNSRSDVSEKTAIGLKYNKSENKVPTIVAKGFGDIANDMLALANQHGVLIHEDEYLSDLLSRLDLGQEIPEGLYVVIAELISFSYVLQGKYPDDWNNPHNRVDHTE